MSAVPPDGELLRNYGKSATLARFKCIIATAEIAVWRAVVGVGGFHFQLRKVFTTSAITIFPIAVQGLVKANGVADGGRDVRAFTLRTRRVLFAHAVALFMHVVAIKTQDIIFYSHIFLY